LWLPCFGIVAGLAILVLLCASLPYMSIGCGVVLTVAFQKIDNAPDTQTCAQGDYQGLQNAYRAVEKCHSKYPPKIGFVYRLISYTSKASVGFTLGCRFMYRSISKRFFGSASAVYL